MPRRIAPSFRFAPLLIASAAAALTVLAPAAQAQQVEVFAGEPFGVGRITLPANEELPGNPWADGRIDVVERNNRILYPVVATGPVRKLLRDFLQTPSSTTVMFLFTGAEPLDLTVYTPRPANFRATPMRTRPAHFNNTLNAWWRDYARTTERHHRSGDYPAIVEEYLALTLARRLGLSPPRFDGNLLGFGDNLFSPEADRGLSLLLGTESARSRALRDVLVFDKQRGAAANNPLPAEPPLPVVEYPPIPANTAIEPIALAVPTECLYVRCGTYDNYIWMRSTLDEWGGQLRNLISERGVDYGVNERNQRQIALKETVIGRLLGGTLISDVAIIGADPFFREGPAIGMLFEASNNVLLFNSLSKQRQEMLKLEVGNATLRDVTLAGHKVSLLSTPDGSIRSYYVIVGNYHLVTTSSHIVERFIEVNDAKGKGSLGESQEFRAARARLPISREDTIFVYLSQAFLHQIASPQYRIEMARRMRSAVEIECLKLARLAAAAEKKPGDTIEQLVAAGLVPAGFGQRSDGSQLKVDGDRLIDSQRGTPGIFVPVPDMKVENITAAEVADYVEFSRGYQAAAAHLDPVVAAVKRFRTPIPGQERIRLELHVTPITGGQYAWLMQYLGEPTPNHLVTKHTDLARVEGVGRGGNYVFLGIQDFFAPLAKEQGKVILKPMGINPASLEMFRGYLGGAPTLGIIEPLVRLVQGGLTAPPDAAGYARYSGGLWQRSNSEMTVLSFKRDVLEQVTPGLSIEPAQRPAQLRANVADLSKSQVAAYVNAKGFEKARDISIGNAELLQSLSRQLHVPRDKCLTVAEDLISARLVCPLGGKYVLVQEPDRPPTWGSDAWTGANRAALVEIPADYTAPVMQWFRGLNLEFTSRAEMISVRADIALQHKAAGGGFVLPGFSLPFRGVAPVPKAPPLPKEITPQLEGLPSVEALPPPEPSVVPPVKSK